MAPREKIQITLLDATDVSASDEPHPDHGGSAVPQSPYLKPSEVGCVLADLKPRIRELSPEAYAAFLEEL
jgi:hypothetical protein